MTTFHGDQLENYTDVEVAKQIVRIYEQAQDETLKLLQSQAVKEVASPAREWMTATQLAE